MIAGIASREPGDHLVFGLLLAFALAIRLPLVGAAPFDFAPMRQHHSALITRAIYLDAHPDAAPSWRRESARDYVAQATIPEPLVVEHVAAWGYALLGREDLRIPRTLSGLFWVFGAVFLHGAARRLSDSNTARLAAALYLFLPYTLGASVSFQPDPLAVMWLCGGLYGLSRFAESPSSARAVAAALLALPALFVRPMTACFLYPVFALLLWQSRTATPGRTLRHAGIYIGLSASAAVIYFAYGFGVDESLRARAAATFVPALFADTAFYRGWLRFIWLAFGPVVFAGALAAALFASRGRLRLLLAGLWIGYGLYGAIFNLHISTHPYYQTMAVPMVALSLAALAGPGARFLSSATRRWIPIAVTVVFVAMALWQDVFSARGNPTREGEYQAIGEAVDHSRQVVFLTDHWGTPLRYHAGIGGRYWPTRFEIDMYRPLGAAGIPDEAPASRLRRLGDQIGGVAFFVVTDMEELARQPDLRDYLNAGFRLIRSTDTHLIYAAR